MLTEKLDIYSFQVSPTFSDTVSFLWTAWRHSKWRRNLEKSCGTLSVEITKQMKLSGPYRGCTNYTNASKYPISEISPISINGRFNDKCRKHNLFAWLVTESQPSLIRFNCRHVIVETHVCMHILLSTSSVRWWNVLLMGGHLDAVIEAEKKWQPLYRWHWYGHQRQPLRARPANIANTRCMTSIRCIIPLMQRCLH